MDNPKDFKYILDANQKATEIYSYIAKQNEKTLDQINELNKVVARLEDEIESSVDHSEELIRQNKDLVEKLKRITDYLEKIQEISKITKDISEDMEKSFKSDVKKQLDEIDKNLFRLVIIFSSGLVGGFVTIVIALIQFFAGKK